MPELKAGDAVVEGRAPDPDIVVQPIEGADVDARQRARDVEQHWLQVDAAGELRAAAEVAQGELVETGLEPPREAREAWVAERRAAGRGGLQAAAQLVAVAAPAGKAPTGERPASIDEWRAGMLLIKEAAAGHVEVIKRDADVDEGKLRTKLEADRQSRELETGGLEGQL